MMPVFNHNSPRAKKDFSHPHRAAKPPIPPKSPSPPFIKNKFFLTHKNLNFKPLTKPP
jgi:hypothetical protein